MALESYSIGEINPLAAIFQGAGGIQALQGGNQVMQQRQVAIDAAKAQAEQAQVAFEAARLQAERAQAAALAKQQAQMRLYDPNLTVQQRAQLTAQYTTAYPDDFKAVESAAKQMSDAQRAQAQGTIAKVTAAQASGNNELALQVLDNNVTALTNSGAPQDQIDAAIFHRDLFKTDPVAAVSGLNLSARALDPSSYDTNNGVAATTAKTVQETAQSAELQPLKVADTQAETEQKVSSTRKNYADIQSQRENNEIRRLELLASKEKNAIEKQRLMSEVETKRTEYGQKQSDRAAAGKQAVAGFTEMKNKAMDLLNDPALDGILGSIQGRTPNLTEASAAVQAKLETLKSGIFLSVSPSLSGTQTAQDAIDMKNAFAALDTKQGEASFRKELKKLITQMSAKEKLAREQYGQPEGGAAGSGVATGQPAYDIKKTSYGSFLGGK